MGVKVWLGVIVSLILIVSSVFFFWDEDEVIGEVDAAMTNESLESESVVEENESVEVSNESKEIVFRTINLSLGSEVEHLDIVRPNKSLNLDESILDVSSDIDDDVFPVFLGGNSELEKYEQEIFLSENFSVSRIQDNDYKDGNKSYGFIFSSGDLILNYVIDFGSKLMWDDLVGEEISIFGKPYLVLSSDQDLVEIELLELPYSFTVSEGEVVGVESTFFNGTNFSVESINEDSVVLRVGGEKTEVLKSGEFYYGEDFVALIESVWYPPKGGGIVNMIISPRRVVLENGTFDYHSDHNNIRTSIIADDSLEEIRFSWYSDEDMFLTYEPGYDVILPFFETLVFTMDKYHRDDDRSKAWDVYLDVVSYSVLNSTLM